MTCRNRYSRMIHNIGDTDMDTSKFIREDGSVDWDSYWAHEQDEKTGFVARVMEGYWSAVQDHMEKNIPAEINPSL